jgi:hypothetical protein
MCDYSLMGVPNRLAREGEDLVVCKFPTGSQGLTPDISVPNTDTPQLECGSVRSLVKRLLGDLQPEKIAVCVPPGARLQLADIPEDLQNSFQVGPTEEVTFTQLTAAQYAYRDAVRFKNGQEILLQRLNKGQRVKVLQLSVADEPVQPVWKAAGSFRF